MTDEPDRIEFTRRLVVAGGLAAFIAPSASAQLAGNAFIISGFPAGGMGDLVSRPLAERMRGRYAANVLVESKVGAGGRIAATFVKRAPADGLTILQIPSSIMTLYPHIYKDLPYDPLVDFAPVTATASYVYSFTASSALPANVRTVAEFVAWARANPEKSSYGIPATGSALHFAAMMLQRATGIEFKAVPYRGGAPSLTDMLAGAIPVSFNVLGEVLPHIRDGKLRCLGVCGPERPKFLPEAPTMKEQGFADIALTEWLGWFLYEIMNSPIIKLRFHEAGAGKLASFTRDNVGRPFAIVVDGRVVTAPIINEPILGGDAQISGTFTSGTAAQLADRIRSNRCAEG